MLIETLIAPRRDGTVQVTAGDGTKYVFAEDDRGELVCDVGNPDHAAWMLSLGDFFPAEGVDGDDVVDLPPVEESATVVHLDDMDKAGLLEYAKERDIDVDGRMSVATLRAKITEAMSDNGENA